MIVILKRCRFYNCNFLSVLKSNHLTLVMKTAILPNKVRFHKLLVVFPKCKEGNKVKNDSDFKTMSFLRLQKLTN